MDKAPNPELYVRCEDPACPVKAMRINGGPAEHWHYIGPEPPHAVIELPT